MLLSIFHFPVFIGTEIHPFTRSEDVNVPFRHNPPRKYLSNNKTSILPCLWVANGCVVTTSWSSSDSIAITGEIRKTSGTTEDVEVVSWRFNSTLDVNKADAREDDVVGWVSAWPTIQVVLLNVDTIVGDIRNGDVFVNHITNPFECVSPGWISFIGQMAAGIVDLRFQLCLNLSWFGINSRCWWRLSSGKSYNPPYYRCFHQSTQCSSCVHQRSSYPSLG